MPTYTISRIHICNLRYTTYNMLIHTLRMIHKINSEHFYGRFSSDSHEKRKRYTVFLETAQIFHKYLLMLVVNHEYTTVPFTTKLSFT